MLVCIDVLVNLVVQFAGVLEAKCKKWALIHLSLTHYFTIYNTCLLLPVLMSCSCHEFIRRNLNLLMAFIPSSYSVGCRL